jgi:kynureninase
MNYVNSLEFARQMDEKDGLAKFRKQFYFPRINGKDAIYFCGNSLGLQPKSVQAAIQQQLDNWAEHAVEGHFKTKDPWITYHETLKQSSAKVVGAKASEVVIMNTLTVNLHLLLVSFYRPTATRYKIICEADAFPSDQYAFESQTKFHGFNPDDAIIELTPRHGEHTLRNEDILTVIEKNANETALVILGGINYYTGQVFDMKTITEAGHKAGAVVGFDLAHAAGNVKLEMHDWNVDFAVWCTYKYLNSGPGGISGAFVHEKHANNNELPRFAGWWGNDAKIRFKMQKGFNPAYGADGWQLSNSPIMLMASLRASLELFEAAGMDNLFAKRDLLTGYLEFILEGINAEHQNDDVHFEIITPKDKKQRGTQLSILVKKNGKKLFDGLMQNGVIGDWREPNVIRLAPVPMYNSFEDVYRFGEILNTLID